MRFKIDIEASEVASLPVAVWGQVLNQIPSLVDRERRRIEYRRQQLRYREDQLSEWTRINLLTEIGDVIANDR